MINKISFKNYKLFKEKQTLEIKPITILIGKNNSGKSAVLKLLTAIEGSLNSKVNQPIQEKNDDVVICNKFADLVYGKFSRHIDLDLSQISKIDGETKTLHLEIVIDVNNNKPLLDFWGLDSSIKLRRIGKGNVYENELDGEEYSCEFLGVYLANYFYKGNPDVSGTFFDQSFRLNTDFISSVRTETQLDYRLGAQTDNKSHPDGRYLYDFLIKDYISTDKIFFFKISNWIKAQFEGWELHVDVDSEPYHIELKKDKLKINITETGKGIGQSLPLIIRAIKPCEQETLILIEEPECHLHPSAHAQLAQLFADSLKSDSNKKYLIETHSQNFILRLRRLVAEGFINENDLKIYYVDFDEELNESNLKEIKVDKGGGVDWWPENIFSETSIETRAIYNAQLNDLKNVGSY